MPNSLATQTVDVLRLELSNFVISVVSTDYISTTYDPGAICFDPDGNLYFSIISPSAIMGGIITIRQVDVSTGVISTLSGNFQNLYPIAPFAMAFQNNSLYFTVFHLINMGTVIKYEIASASYIFLQSSTVFRSVTICPTRYGQPLSNTPLHTAAGLVFDSDGNMILR